METKKFNLDEVRLKPILYYFTGGVGSFITSITLFESNIYGGIFFGLMGFVMAHNLLNPTK